jgi:hypothetical protein
MKSNLWKIILCLSLLLNLALLPVNYLALTIPDAKLAIYEAIATKVSNPEIVFVGDSITLGGGIWGFRLHRYDFKTSNIAKGGIHLDDIKFYTLMALEKSPKCLFIMGGTERHQ